MSQDDRPVAFGQHDAGRIGESVLWTERFGRDRDSNAKRNRHLPRARVVRLVGEPETQRYSFREQRTASDGVSWEDRPGGIASVQTSGMDNVNQTCVAIHIQTGLPADVSTGAIGLLIETYTYQGDREYVFIGPMVGTIFAIKMTQTGGSNGTNSTAASWTYTITDRNDNQLVTSYNPTTGDFKRPTYGKMDKATAGTGYYDENGTFTLSWCNEVPTASECTTP